MLLLLPLPAEAALELLLWLRARLLMMMMLIVVLPSCTFALAPIDGNPEGKLPTYSKKKQQPQLQLLQGKKPPLLQILTSFSLLACGICF
jgi:hypothetical protein